MLKTKTAGAKEDIEYNNYCAWKYIDHANL